MAKKAKGIAPSYFQQLLPEAKKRYQEKIRIISGIDPFTLSLASARHGQSNNPAALPCLTQACHAIAVSTKISQPGSLILRLEDCVITGRVSRL